MRCPLALIEDVFTKGALTGVAMTLGATWHSWMDFVKIWTWPGQIVQALSGVVLALVYAFGFVMFPLFFVDAVLRAAIIAVIAPLAAALSLFPATRHVTGRALWDLAQSALTMVFASVAAGLASQGVAHVYTTLTTPDGSPLSDWPTLIGELEAGRLKLSIFDQSYWAILAIGVITIFMIRGAARMAAALTGVSADNVSGARAGLAQLVGGGTRLTVEAGQRSGRLLLAPVSASAARRARSVRLAAARTAGRLVQRSVPSLAAKVSGRAGRARREDPDDKG
jgi:hypothetical protein